MRSIFSFLIWLIVCSPIQLLAQSNPTEQLVQAMMTGASEEQQLAKIKQAIKDGGKIDGMTTMGFSPMRYALMLRKETVVRYFIKQGADVSYKDPQQQSHLHLMCMLGYTKMIQLLLESGADPNVKDVIQATPLIAAARSQKIESVKALLNFKNVDLEAKDISGGTALLQTVSARSKPIAQLLIQAKANINTTDSQQRTPLHIAIDNKDVEILQLLCEQGANVNAQDYSKRTPLVLAIEENCLECCKILLKHKADPNIKDSYEKNAFDYAKAEDKALFLNALKNPNTSTTTPAEKQVALQDRLINAIRLNQPEKVKALVAEGANPNYINKAGFSPISYALQVSPQSAHILMKNGVDFNQLLPDGRNLLHIVSQQHIDLSFIQELKDKGIDINQQDKKGNTPIFYAIESQALQHCKKLLQLGAKLTIKNDDGETPLEYAKKLRSLNLVAFLENPATYREDMIWKIRNVFPKASILKKSFQDWVKINQNRVIQAKNPQQQLFEQIRLANFYHSAGHYSEELTALNKAVDIGKSTSSKAHAHALSYLAKYFIFTKELDKAQPILDQAWKLCNGSSNLWDTVTVSIQNQYLLLGKPQEFKSKKAFYDAFLKAYDMDNKPIYSSSLCNTYLNAAKYYAHQGEWDKTLQVKGVLATQLASVYFGKEEFYLLQSIFGELQVLEGNPFMAAAHIEQGIADLARETGVNHPYYIQSIHQLGQSYLLKSDYASAELLLLYAQTQYKKSSPNHQKTGVLYGDLAELYYKLGNYELAINYINQALKHLDKYASSASELHTKQIQYAIYLKMSVYDSLEQHLKQLMLDAEQQFGLATPLYYQTSLALAKYYLLTLQSEKFNQVEQLLQSAHKFYEELIINQAKKASTGLLTIQAFGQSSELLGMLYHEQKKFDQAMYWYNESMKRRYSYNSQEFISTRMNQARVLYQLQREKEANFYLYQAIEDYLKLIDRTFPTLSENEKQLFFHQIKDDFNFFNYHLPSKKPDCPEFYLPKAQANPLSKIKISDLYPAKDHSGIYFAD